MDFHGGPNDRDSYGRYPDGRDGGNAEEPFDRGDYRDRGGYGQSPYSDSRYGQSPYGQSPYGGDAYGGMPRDDYGNTGRTQMPRSDYGNTGRTQMPRSDYGNTRRTQMPRDGYGNTGRTQMPRADYGNTGRTQMPRDDYGNTGRTQMPRGSDARGYAPGEYPQDDYGAYGEREDGYECRGDYGRERTYGNDYEGAGYYGSDDAHDGRDYSDTGRTQMRRSDYERDTRPAEPDYSDEIDYDSEPAERVPRKKKKKRSKFSRFMRGLGAYIAQMPTRTLILIGGSIAVVLVGVILLVILLPKSAKPAQIPDSGQLSIADITPTPSLPPTTVPEVVTPAPEDTPIADPFNGAFIKEVGETNDVIPAVQERLVELGYMDMPADGYTTTYGKATKNAIRIFQVKNYESSDDWDGILGAGTYTLLMGNDAKAFYLARGDGDSRTKDLTQLVDAVKKLQTRLVELGYLTAGSDTGVFASGTATAVKTFQQYHGLLADGWAGQATLQMLYSDQAMTEAVGKANPITPTPDGAAATSADPNASPAAVTTPDSGTVPATSTSPEIVAS